MSCDICGKSSCCASFHSIEAQEEASKTIDDVREERDSLKAQLARAKEFAFKHLREEDFDETFCETSRSDADIFDGIWNREVIEGK